MRSKIYISNFTPEELKFELSKCSLQNENQPEYRYKQILSWYYKKLVRGVCDMTDLPRSFRDTMRDVLSEQSKLVKIYKSNDRTEKFLIAVGNSQQVESVLIEDGETTYTEASSSRRNTLCISTQVGCPIRCIFCASGIYGLKRNLNTNEIVEQVIIAQRCLKNRNQRLNNIVYMGMGEPLLNYDNVVKSLKILESKDCIGIGKNKITLSTSGIIEKIKELMKEHIAPNLAISLHSALEEKRKKLIPYVVEHSPRKLLDSALVYKRKTGREVSFECVLIKDINCGEEDLKTLIKLLKGTGCKVNLIPLNYVRGIDLKAPDNDVVERFRFGLLKEKIFTSVRKRCGDDISAACGQLTFLQH